MNLAQDPLPSTWQSHTVGTEALRILRLHFYVIQSQKTPWTV